jgi:CubicO group peptidase (beta-lactamase class C family)
MKVVQLSVVILVLAIGADALAPSGLDDFIVSEMKKGGIPGLSVAVVDHENILFRNAYGYSDPQKKTPATNETLFTLASISKTIISFVAMRLFDAGLFELDDDVSTHLDFKLVNPHFPEKKITMRQLMSHTSSIDDAQYSTNKVYNSIVVEGGKVCASSRVS